ncbi:MAG: SIS domain-containing protein [Thaumarchaeota archaeon]|nr:SIS domain-containing protein [Nitrososphaerota archaeon]
MCKIYDTWPVLAREYYEKNYAPVDFKDIEHIVFCGMGGSGVLGDVLSSILSQTKIHLHVVKGYHFPKISDSKTLVVASSASGNTLETLSNMSDAKKKNCKIICFSSGGKMLNYCIKNNLEYRTIPMMHSPRASFPVYLYSILNVLKNTIPISKKDVTESISKLEKTRLQIYSSNLSKENPALNLAQGMSKIPVIYYPAGLGAVATRFKNSLQENVKMHVISEDVIEACHNGIVSWEKPSIAKPILIQGRDDYIKTKLLWKIIKKYFEKNNIEYQEVYSVSGNILSKLVNLVYLLDYASIYSAVLTKTDPTPVKSIDFIKKRLQMAV